MELLAYSWDVMKLEVLGESLEDTGQKWIAAMDLAR